MADLTALDMAKEHLVDLQAYVNGIKRALETPNEDGQIDCSFASLRLRAARSSLDNLSDHIFALNREQKGSDEAIQKQQMLYRKEQERLAREARERAEQEALKPVPFSLD